MPRRLASLVCVLVSSLCLLPTPASAAPTISIAWTMAVPEDVSIGPFVTHGQTILAGYRKCIRFCGGENPEYRTEIIRMHRDDQSTIWHRRLAGHTMDLAITPDGQTALVQFMPRQGRRAIAALDTSTGAMLWSQRFPATESFIHPMAVAGDGSRVGILTPKNDAPRPPCCGPALDQWHLDTRNLVRILDIATGRLLLTRDVRLDESEREHPRLLGFTGDELVIIIHSSLVNLRSDKSLSVTPITIPADPADPRDHIQSAVLGPNGTVYAVLNRTYIVDPEEGTYTSHHELLIQEQGVPTTYVDIGEDHLWQLEPSLEHGLIVVEGEDWSGPGFEWVGELLFPPMRAAYTFEGDLVWRGGGAAEAFGGTLVLSGNVAVTSEREAGQYGQVTLLTFDIETGTEGTSVTIPASSILDLVAVEGGILVSRSDGGQGKFIDVYALTE